jgi:hypothetical protein
MHEEGIQFVFFEMKLGEVRDLQHLRVIDTMYSITGQSPNP